MISNFVTSSVDYFQIDTLKIPNYLCHIQKATGHTGFGLVRHNHLE